MPRLAGLALDARHGRLSGAGWGGYHRRAARELCLRTLLEPPMPLPVLARPLLAALLFAVAAHAQADAPTVRTDEVRADLLVHAPSGVRPGQPMWLGLRLQHAPHWHTYWKNPGDSGLPTTLAWQLPAGAQAGEIDWPAPQRLPFGPLVNYGYEGTVVLPVPFSVPAGLAGDRVEVKLRADWLVCRTECIPQSGDFSLSLPLGPAPQVTHGADFEAAWAARPQAVPTVRAEATPADGALQVRLTGLSAAQREAASVQVFPEMPGVTEPAGTVEAQVQGEALVLRVPLAAQRTASPERLPAVLRLGDGPALALDIAVAGAWPAGAVAPAPGLSPALQQALDENLRRAAAQPQVPAPAAPGGWAWALFAALAGGLLLNLMPCVFPVLSLKVLGLVHHAPSPNVRWQSGLAYTAGVVLSFLALAGLLIALRAAGEQLGWGFQLQSPAVVAALAALFTLIGLNLAGVFEFGSVLPSAWASARARHPAGDAFLSGVLAVAVASPCTAPFMGASLGLALSMPSAQALSVFAALGLGMALPYLLVSAWPRLSRWLPRPGPWMAQFRTAMAFPMFATVVWLVWVLGQQAGLDAVAGWLAVLVALGFAVWAWAGPGLGRRARLGWGLPAAASLAAALWLGVPLLGEPAAPAAAAPAAGERWQAWSPGRVEALQAEGRPVFVDFTAAWCVTCQFNKRTTLADKAVLADFDRRGVTLLRADWTRRDPDITQALAGLGRSGVPVYVLYRAGQPPIVLSEVLSAQEVRSALSSL